MLTRTRRVLIALVAGLAAAAVGAAPAQAIPVCPISPLGVEAVVPDCGEDPPPPPPDYPTTPPAPAYNLQGVIQRDSWQHLGSWPYRQGGIRVRAYSRLANAGNDRVDASYINVRCYATTPTGYQTTDYDSENNGALVDVTFNSPLIPVTGVLPYYRTVTVTCTHHAEKYGVSYDTTSSAQFVIPE